MVTALLLATALQAVVTRTPSDKEGRFQYRVELPGVNPMDHDIVGLWAQEEGWFSFQLSPGVRITRIWTFGATDVGKTFEGDVNVWTSEGKVLSPRSMHKELPFMNILGFWPPVDLSYEVPVDNPWLFINWVCRVTGPAYSPITRESLGFNMTRCHFSLLIDGEMR